MTRNLVLILEDEPLNRAVFELRITDIGYAPISYSNLADAISSFDRTGDIYNRYFLDMRVPSSIGEEPEYYRGLRFREHLIKNGVGNNKIFLMSAGVSHNDEMAAKEYNVDINQIVGKDRFTEHMLRELLGVK